jgi:hypothetical protein
MKKTQVLLIKQSNTRNKPNTNIYTDDVCLLLFLSIFPKRQTGSSNHGIVERENGCFWKQ